MLKIMKRLLFLIFSVGLSIVSVAQVQSPVATGNATGRKVLADKTITFNIGSPIPYICNGGSSVKLQVGFPYNVLYMDKTFPGDLFVSKGYYPDIIQLRWEVVNNADRIERFEIFRKKPGETDSVWVDNADASARKWEDNYAEANEIYQYTLVAVGIPGGNQQGFTQISGTGFRSPLATISGRVTYTGGTGVGGVTVTATTGDAIASSCIAPGGTGYVEVPQYTEMDIASAFTFQAYVKFNGITDAGIFEKEGNYKVTYESGKFRFYVGAEYAELPYEMNGDEYVHLSCTYNGEIASIYIPAYYIDGDGVRQDTLSHSEKSITGSIANNESPIYFGRSDLLNFTGNLDEIRIWNKALGAKEIINDHNRYISGKEPGILGYWRMNEGFGGSIYDISKTGTRFNENHGNFVGAVSWSNDYPPAEKLGYKGITDSEGNYIISGIPFLTDGSAYRFTPMMSPHYFQPEYKILFMSEDASVHNNVDFTDLASVSVSLKAVYNTGTDFPVSDVLVKVDGNYLANDNNELVKTREDGTVDFRVPIGYHYLSFEKQGHTFENPYYPARDSGSNIVRKLFDKNIPSLKVTDTTRIILAGRIVGGPVEAGKTLGSNTNPSKNNIGTVSVTLMAENELDIDSTDSSPKTISFSTDPETGEYQIKLIPEKFKPASKTAIKNDYYTFNSDEDMAVIDLTNQFFDKYETDSVFARNYLGEMEFTKLDTVAGYNLRRDWVYRSTPSLAIFSYNGKKIISEETMFYSDGNGADTIPLAIEGANGAVTYTFGKPVFQFAKEYRTQIKAFEEYINHELTEDNVDYVPVTDGIIKIANDLALMKKQVELNLDANGEAGYNFQADFPNIAAPYTKNFNITLKTGSSIVQLPPMEAYILGGRPTGNNFVTTGPNEVDFILRDPPGSESSAFLEQGFTSYTTKTSSVANGEEGDGQLAFQMGVRIATSAGTPFFQVQNEFDTDNFIGVTFEHSYNDEGGYETNSSTTFGETFSTSDDPDFVGVDGDVFVGHSTNIVYGISKLMKIMPKEKVPSYSDTISKYNGYALSIENGLRVNPEFNTMFVYSQRIVKDEMIPHLEYLRNMVIEGEHYTKVFTDSSDPKYASNNDDKKAWGSHVSDDPQNGPSYIFNPPAPANPDSVVIDSVRFYNNQISNWKSILAQNERQKLAAKPDDKHKNISFGAGSTYEAYIETEYDSVYTDSWEFSVAPGIATSIGFSANRFGFRADLNQKYVHSGSGSDGSGSGNSKTVGYSLVDGDPENYITVDVLKCQSGNGPVFVTRGGQTSCPYEGEELTQYYLPGSKTLSYATMQIDGPQLTCENPISPLIPETSPAYFTMQLSNVSDAEKDNWYIIGVDVASNPDGAKVFMDGSAINEGIAVHVPYGQTVTKTLEVVKGRSDVNEYENLAIYLRSQCQDDISDTVMISAYFASACSPVQFVEPANQWVVNVENNDSMLVVISGFNMQREGFNDIHLQYKPTGSSLWTTTHIFTNNPAEAGNDITTLINDLTKIQYLWDMRSLMDRNYDIRLVTHCADGSVNYSETLTGILDGQRPQVFGSPQPADGILDVEDEISVQFNEPIEKGLLVPSKFNISGALNNGNLLHDSYLRFNGISGYSVIPDGISLNDKSFSIELWFQTDHYENMILFSQGNDPKSNVEIGLTAARELSVKLGSMSGAFHVPLKFTGENPYNAWQHIGVVFDYETHDLTVYQNDNEFEVARNLSTVINTNGKIYIGKSAVGGPGNFNGTIHELRIWSKPLDFGIFYAQQYSSLTGNETGLYGYWPMNESFGNLASDKASNRHMEVYADWEINPGGQAWDFSKGSPVKINAAYFAVIPEMDFTIEFWFKSGLPTDTVCFFSNQKGDGTDGVNQLDKAMSICGLPDGKIVVFSKGNVFEAAVNNYFNNQWHHFSLVVRRRGNVVSMIDGKVQNEKENTVIGGLAGANMWLGIQKYDNVEGSGSRYRYSGLLDEFRIWTLARTTVQIELDRNSKLKGDETALEVYIPFEGYVTDEFGTTALKPSVLNYVSNAAFEFTQNGSTPEAPNIRNVRPKQEISFDFVASEDKIILVPKEFLMPQLEKNIIEITVEGVEDKYGNRMASPATWTAYVHRNQVRWEDERRSFTKEIYKPMEFVSTIKNTGGQQVGYSLMNLPPWLTAAPSAGVINPESTLEIHFTVNQALNIGEYNEDIILRTENGFDEKLPVSVKVFKTPPDWKVDPTRFEFTMNMVGKIKIENVYSTDEFDKLAVFVNDTIRGVANVRYVEEFDSYLVFMNVYGNDNGEQLEFRIWDASAGQILDDVKPFDVAFVPNEVTGTTTEPVIFEATGLHRQYIPLAKGWNWVSFNKLSSKQNNLNAFLSALEPEENDQIKSHGGGFNNFDFTSGWLVGGIDSIDNRHMYQIKISKNDTIIYSGEKLAPGDVPMDLSPGWNHIGYLPDLAMDVNDALRLYTARASDVIKSQFAFAMYDPRVGWLGTLDVMQPGLGYMLKSQSNVSFTYPNTTVFKSAKLDYAASPPVAWKTNVAQFDGNLSLVARVETGNISGLAVNSEMILGAFINGECHGFVSPVANSGIGYSPFFLNVSNTLNGQTVEFLLFDGMSGKTYHVQEDFPFVRDAVYGTTTNPEILTVNTVVTGAGEVDKNSFIRCYPNPFNSRINIEFNGAGGNVIIDVVDATGSLVKQVFNGMAVSGRNMAVWDGKNSAGNVTAPGMYFVRFITGDAVQTFIVSKIR